MKMRALLLIVLMIGGTYGMIQTIQDYKEKEFVELLSSMNAPFNSLIFTKPSPVGPGAETWTVDEANEIENFLGFLQNYHVRKMKPEEINPHDDVNHFSISLQDENGNIISIMVSEDLIIQNSLLYYEVVDGPLDIDWLVQFFLKNKL